MRRAWQKPLRESAAGSQNDRHVSGSPGSMSVALFSPRTAAPQRRWYPRQLAVRRPSGPHNTHPQWQGVAVIARPEDRRAQTRFDIVGDIAAAVQVVARFPIDNIAPGGARFRCQLPLPVGSVHRFTLIAGDDEFTTQVKVRHMTATPAGGGEPAFAIGVEFLS